MGQSQLLTFFMFGVFILIIVLIITTMTPIIISEVIDKIRFDKLKNGDIYINKSDIDNPFNEDKRYVIIMEKRVGKYNNRYIKYKRINADYFTTLKSSDFFQIYRNFNDNKQ